MAVSLRNTSNRYGLIAQLLHWAVVVGIVLQYVWAWRIDNTESIREQFSLVTTHKSIGMTILLLVILRLLWRAFNKPPPYPSTMKSWEIKAANFTHALLYALILLMPLTGWMYTSAAGYGGEFWGLMDVPDLVPTSEQLESFMHRAHESIGWVIPIVVAVHVFAALRHHFSLKNRLTKS